MTDGPTYKRRDYLVDRAYQLQFVTRLFIAILAIAALTYVIASWLLWRNLYLPHQETSPALMTSALIGITLTLLVELLIAIPLLFLLGIRQTHRVVGPMKRITRALEAIGSGNFHQRIRLRKGDTLEELAQAINRMAEHLEARGSQRG